MSDRSRDEFHVAAGFQPLVRMIGLDAEAVFGHPEIRVWRSIADRENCTLDAEVDGRRVRWHVKRYTAVRTPGATPAEREVAGVRLLAEAGIPTVPLVAWGVLADRRSFVIVDDLAGYRPGDKLLEAGGATFEELLGPTAELAARLHNAGLHHRDLYLCHFFIPRGEGAGEPEGDFGTSGAWSGGGAARLSEVGKQPLRLIDCARVKRLPRFLTRYRWVVKDLAQFWYSTLKHPEITDGQRRAWLRRYAEKTGSDSERLRRSIARKVAWIGRHDARLNRAQPNRNISIPREAAEG